MSGRADLARLFRSEAPSLRRFLTRFGPSIAPDDVAQDSFLRLCAAKADDVIAPRAFLFKTARNLAVDALRRNKAAPFRSVAHIDSAPTTVHAPSPEDARIADDTVAALTDALAALPTLQREALLLRRVERLPPAEVARRLGISERQVQRLVLKAIAFCHARLTSDNDAANG